MTPTTMPTNADGPDDDLEDEEAPFVGDNDDDVEVEPVDVVDLDAASALRSPYGMWHRTSESVALSLGSQFV